MSPEGTFAYLRSILWENRIKGKHLWRNLAASFLEGILASTGQGVIQGDLLLPWIHLQERAGFWGISSGCGTDTEHDFHLVKTKHGNNMDQRAGCLTTKWSSARDGLPIYGSSEPFLDTLWWNTQWISHLILTGSGKGWFIYNYQVEYFDMSINAE